MRRNYFRRGGKMIGEPIIFDGHSRKSKWPDNNVKLFREGKGLTRAQLGKIVGLQETIISFIEQGEIKPLVRTMRKIADALDAEMEALFPKGWRRIKR